MKRSKMMNVKGAHKNTANNILWHSRIYEARVKCSLMGRKTKTHPYNGFCDVQVKWLI